MSIKPTTSAGSKWRALERDLLPTPMWRFKRVAGAFAIVFVAYLVYATAAVPWIEPEVADAGTIAPPPPPPDYVLKQRELLKQWFLPGDWELTSPKVLETAQGMLLFQTYNNLKDGLVELRPCTMIFVAEGEDDTLAERQRQATIMRAVGGAILQFDTPLDAGRAQMGQLVGGQLAGPVTIRSDYRQPGPHDDLLIHCSQLELAQQRIFSSQPLDFQLGPNRGRGRRLQVQLAAGKSPGAFHGIMSLEISQDVEMRIEPGQADMFPGQSPDPRSVATGKAQPPVEIHCRGPFRYDFQRRVATFRDRVEVTRLLGNTQPDRMTGDLLSVHFVDIAAAPQPPAAPLARPATTAQPAAAKRDSLRLQPTYVNLVGNPVTVRAPSSSVEATGQQLEYDVASGGVTLRGANQVQLVQQGRQLQAREIFARPGANGALGEFRAVGPGWLRGNSPDDKQQTLVARWSQLAHFRPHQGEQLLSLEGAAHVEATGQGTLDAETIYLWMIEIPPGPVTHIGPRDEARRNELRPDRMTATGGVRIASPQLTGTFKDLQVWFEPMPQTSRVVAGPRSPRFAGASLAASVGNPATSTGLVAGQSDNPAASTVAATPANEPPRSRFDIAGSTLRMRARMGQNSAELAELEVDENVLLVEEPLQPTNEKPLRVAGQKLHVVQPAPEQQVVTVTGNPATIEARGLTMVAGVVHLDRGQNLIWTDTAGTMNLPVPPRAVDGAPLPGPPVPIDIQWARQMRFDGRIARFEEGVVARHATQTLRTALLEAEFNRQIEFGAMSNPAESNPSDAQGPKPEIDRLECRRGVWIESRTVEAGAVTSYDQMQMEELTLWQLSGDVSGSGPGWISSVRVGQASSTPGMPGAAAQPQVAAAGQPPGLTYLNVRFQRAMTGNLRRKQLQFENQIRAVYGPVPDWQSVLDIDRPETWGPRGIGLTCDRMLLAEGPALVRGQNNFELETQGNTLVEGTGFTARSARLTYSQGKSLLVFEGDGRTPARLYRQVRPGSAPVEAVARKILYWPSTNRAEVADAQFLDFTELPRAQPAPPQPLGTQSTNPQRPIR